MLIYLYLLGLFYLGLGAHNLLSTGATLYQLLTTNYTSINLLDPVELPILKGLVFVGGAVLLIKAIAQDRIQNIIQQNDFWANVLWVSVPPMVLTFLVPICSDFIHTLFSVDIPIQYFRLVSNIILQLFVSGLLIWAIAYELKLEHTWNPDVLTRPDTLPKTEAVDE